MSALQDWTEYGAPDVVWEHPRLCILVLRHTFPPGLAVC